MTKGSSPHTRKSRGAPWHGREPWSPHQTSGTPSPLNSMLPWGDAAHGLENICHHEPRGEGPHHLTDEEVMGTTMGGQKRGISRLHRIYYGKFQEGWGKRGLRCFEEEQVGKQQDQGTKGAGWGQARAGQCTCLTMLCVWLAQSVLASH